MDEWMGRPLATVNRFLLALTELNRVMNLCRSKTYLLGIRWMIKLCERREYCGLLKGAMPHSLEETPRLKIDRQNKENHPNIPQIVERMPQAKYFVGRLTILGKYRTRSTGSSFYPVSELQLSWCLYRAGILHSQGIWSSFLPFSSTYLISCKYLSVPLIPDGCRFSTW